MTQIADRHLETDPASGDSAARRHVPVLGDETAVAEARRLAETFAAGAAARDRDRVLPYEQIDELAEAGLLALTVPAAYGGPDVSASTLTEVFRLIATADPNIAQIPHSHFVYANLVRVAGTPEQQRFFFAELLEGGRFGNAQSELKTPGVNVVETRLTRDEPGWFRLNGAKGYCTGAIFATWIPMLARLDDGTAEGGEELVAFVAAVGRGRHGRRRLGWHGPADDSERHRRAARRPRRGRARGPAWQGVRRSAQLRRVRAAAARGHRGRDRRWRAGRGGRLRAHQAPPALRGAGAARAGRPARDPALR